MCVLTGVTGEILVGYQTRLESRKSNGALTFCSLEVFLRSLIHNTDCLKGISHLIVDHIHRRDRFTDVLLSVLRLRLLQYSHLRLVLLTSDPALTSELSAYFGTEGIVIVPPLAHRSQEYFMEDIEKSLRKDGATATGSHLVDLSHEYDDLIKQAFFKDSDEVLLKLLHLVRQGSIPIDYQHSRSGMTILMAATINGKIEIVKSAIVLGANPTLKVTIFIFF